MLWVTCELTQFVVNTSPQVSPRREAALARIRLHRAAAVLAAIALGYTTLTSTGSTASPGTTPAEMVDSMSLEEKVGQLFVAAN